MDKQEWWNQVFWNNTVYSYLFAAGIIVVCFLAIRIFKSIILKRLKAWSLKTKTNWDDILIMGLERFVIPLLYVTVVYSAFSSLKVPAKAGKIAHIAYLVVLTWFMLRMVSAAIKRLLLRFARNRGDGETGSAQISGMMILVNIVIWVIGIIFLIDNLGYDVTTLVTGLGIGGIAIALAAQTILGDLFSYFVIFLDRPFEIGDSITIGTQTGTVERIGIKTTRIRTLAGDQLICSNTDLTNSRINNFKRLETRRIAFIISVVYSTPKETVAAIPGIVQKIIQAQEKIEYVRGHFFRFGPSSLDFEFVYNVLDPEYGTYMELQEKILLGVLDSFNKRGIQFALPTQTLYIAAGEPTQKPSAPATDADDQTATPI